MFIGGSFDNVGGSPHNALARTDAIDRRSRADCVQPRQRAWLRTHPGPDLLHRRRRPTTSPPTWPSGRPSPAGRTAATSSPSYDPATGNATWEQNGPDGDAQAIELINGTLFGGFHGGWNGNAAKRITGLNIANGAPTAFQPNSGGVLGVRGMAQGGGRLIAVGDFNFMGTTGQVRGLAIFD